MYVIKGRWPEGEAVVINDARYAYEYAKNVIKERWPEGEAVIATDAEWAYYYAQDVIKGRFPEGEAVIAKDKHYEEDYIICLKELASTINNKG